MGVVTMITVLVMQQVMIRANEQVDCCTLDYSNHSEICCSLLTGSLETNITAMNSTSILISWSHLPAEHGQELLASCTHATTIDTTDVSYKVEARVNSSTNNVTLLDLLPNSTYNCCVSVGNEDNTSAANCTCIAVGWGLGGIIVLLVLLLIVTGLLSVHFALRLRDEIDKHLDTTRKDPDTQEEHEWTNPIYGAANNAVTEADRPPDPSAEYDTFGPQYEECDTMTNPEDTSGIDEPNEPARNSESDVVYDLPNSRRGRVHRQVNQKSGEDGYSHLKH